MRRANAQLQCDRRMAATHVGCLRAGRNRAFTNPPSKQDERGSSSQGELTMNASRLTAIGLVVAAGLWIASGHFLPHGAAETAVRAGEGEAKKLFRVAVATT